jgi:hypothetical protein
MQAKCANSSNAHAILSPPNPMPRPRLTARFDQRNAENKFPLRTHHRRLTVQHIRSDPTPTRGTNGWYENKKAALEESCRIDCP